MKTFVTISAGVLLALSCVATSDARLHPNREGQTQSEPSNYNPDYNSQTNTRNWDNSCLHCGCGACTDFALLIKRVSHHAAPGSGSESEGMQERLTVPSRSIRHRRIKRQCLAPPSKWPKSLCPPMSRRGSPLRRSNLCYSGRTT